MSNAALLAHRARAARARVHVVLIARQYRRAAARRDRVHAQNQRLCELLQKHGVPH